MNIWALDKDIRIKHVLLLLAARFGSDSYVVDATPQLVPAAVRLCKPDEPAMSVYLYTYGQQDDCYGVHLEFPAHPETPLRDTVEIKEDLDFEQLVEVLQVHFDVVLA